MAMYPLSMLNFWGVFPSKDHSFFPSEKNTVFFLTPELAPQGDGTQKIRKANWQRIPGGWSWLVVGGKQGLGLKDDLGWDD